MLNFIIFFIVILVFSLLSEPWLRKKLKIAKRKGVIYKGVSTFQRWIERAMLIAFLISLWFIENTLPLLIAFFLTLTSFRALMEWKYERETKEYILTFYSIFIYLLVLGIAWYFNIV